MLSDSQVAELLRRTEGQSGNNLTTECPTCGERNFTVKREGVKLLWHCFRASCGEQGGVFIPGALSMSDDTARVSEEAALRPYRGDILSLSDAQAEKLSARFGVNPKLLKQHVYTDNLRYVLPIYAPRGTTRGHTLRLPWGGTELGDKKAIAGVKSLTFQSEVGPLMSWYGPSTEQLPTILVEDQMSAIKISARLVRSVALLGTNLNTDKVAELQRYTRRVILALDADATSKAFDLARTWQHAFDYFRVVILTKDVKDMSHTEISYAFTI